MPMILPDVKIASETFWLCAVVTALMDVGLVLFLVRRIQPDRFRQLHWAIVLATAAFWMSYGLLLFALAWESYYAKFLPNPAERSLARSLLELLIYQPLGLILWWLALRLPGNPVVNFCLLGGLQSVPEHLWGIYGLGMLDQVPFLQEASPASVLAFAVPEYVLYWGSVLSLALLLQRGWWWCRQWVAARAQSRRGQCGAGWEEGSDPQTSKKVVGR
jgi:hypothetical protein